MNEEEQQRAMQEWQFEVERRRAELENWATLHNSDNITYVTYEITNLNQPQSPPLLTNDYSTNSFQYLWVDQPKKKKIKLYNR